MIKIQGKLPRNITLAYSGGVDSRVMFEFLKKNHQIHLIHVNHGDEASEKEAENLRKLKTGRSVKITSIDAKYNIPNGESREHFWSKVRKEKLKDFGDVIMCHHLDDCVETWIASSLKGNPTIIPYRSGNIIRPFRMTSKDDILSYAKRHKIKWVEDKSNSNPEYSERSYIRNVLMPHALRVNPGLKKTVMKLVQGDSKFD